MVSGASLSSSDQIAVSSSRDATGRRGCHQQPLLLLFALHIEEDRCRNEQALPVHGVNNNQVSRNSTADVRAVWLSSNYKQE